MGRVWARICLLGMAGLSAGVFCMAQDAPAAGRRFIRILPQSLSTALQVLGGDRQLQVIYRSEVVGSIRTRGAVGDLTTDEALGRLLQGTGLTYHYLDGTTVTIVPVAAVPDGAPSAGASATGPAGNSPDLRSTRLPGDRPGTRDGPGAGPARSGRTASLRQVSTPARQDNRLEEVVVTAEKTAEVTMKIPLSLSVYSGDALRRQGIARMADLQDIDPELNVGQSPAGINISLRGVATTDVTSKGDQDIAFNIDGIPVGRPRQMGLAFLDLQRVEVLRGPQGTLYGRSATGGVINVITNKPQDGFASSASLEFGDYSTRRGEAVVNLPLAAALAVRVAAGFNVRDGYLNPVLGRTATVNGVEPARDDENDYTVRTSALWKVGGSATLLLTGTAGHVGGIGSNYNALYDRAAKSGPAARDIYYNPMGGAVDDGFHNLNAELNVDLGAAHLVYDGAHLHYNAHDSDTSSDNDPDGAADQGGNGGHYLWRNYQGSYTTDSHELRFTNARPQRLEWVAGANYYREYILEHDQNWATMAAPGTDGAGLDCPYYAPDLYYACNAPNPIFVGPTEHQSIGVFSQGGFHLSNALKLVLGLRYSHDSMYRHGVIAAGPGPAPRVAWTDAQGRPCAPPRDCIGNTADYGAESSGKITWRLGADYQLIPGQMIYASVATGYKAGGFNDYDPVTRATSEYGPEALTAYELGYKGRILPNLQYDSDVYYYDYSRMQVTGAAFFGLGATGPIIFIYTRTAPATLYGWENELRFKVTPADLIDATLAFERTYYRHLAVGTLIADPFDWSGYSLDNAPRAAGTLAYDHRWYLPGGAYFSGRVSTKLSSGYFVSNFGGTPAYPGAYAVPPRQYRQGSYSRSSVLFGYTSASGKFDIQGFVRNIEDRLQLTSAPQNIDPADPDSANAGVTAPRTVGVRLTIRY